MTKLQPLIQLKISSHCGLGTGAGLEAAGEKGTVHGPLLVLAFLPSSLCSFSHLWGRGKEQGAQESVSRDGEVQR